MTWHLNGPERNLPPDEFQSRLTHVGGVNKYDEPCFKIGWAQTETFVAGGVWSIDERYYKGYRRLLAGSGEPCWTLFQWHPPEEYGSPESYYVFNYDETTALQTLGEYPYQGRYEVVYNLRWNEIVAGKISFHTLPLNTRVFDVVAQIVALAKDISIEKTRAAYLAAREAEERAKTRDIERHLLDRSVPFAGGAVSFTRQGIRSTVIDRKMLEMQWRWNQLSRAAADFRPGLQTR
jgi:hypothetical protein